MVGTISRKVLTRIDYLVLAFGMFMLGMKEKTQTQNPVSRTLLMRLRPLACFCVAWSLGRLLTRDLEGTDLQANVEFLDAK
jgi:hypothetical protein